MTRRDDWRRGCSCARVFALPTAFEGAQSCFSVVKRVQCEALEGA